jgi:hypothetical protein
MNPYSEAWQSKTKMSCGTVKLYAPSTKLYTVVLDGIGDRNCRKMLTGVDRPVPRGRRVLVVNVRGADWIIVGELDSIPVTADIIPKTFEDQAAIDEASVSNEAGGTDDKLPSWRQIDSAGTAEDPNFTGDVSLENRADQHIQRSKVKVYGFGDILIKSSNICFDYWHKKENTILRRAKNLITRAFGYFYSVSTQPSGLNAGRVTEKLTIASNAPSPATLDVQVTRGYLQPSLISAFTSLDPTPTLFNTRLAATGSRTQFGEFYVQEIDNDTSTIRSELVVGDSSITTQIGTFTAENLIHPKTLLRNPSTTTGLTAFSGLHCQYGDAFDLTVGTSDNTISLLSGTNPTQKITIDPTAIKLEQGGRVIEITNTSITMEDLGQSFKLDDSGLTIDVLSFTLNSGVTSMTTTATHTIEALAIQLN